MRAILEWVFLVAVVGFVGLLLWAIGGVGMSALGLGEKHDANADTMYSNNYDLHPNPTLFGGLRGRRGRSS